MRSKIADTVAQGAVEAVGLLDGRHQGQAALAAALDHYSLTRFAYCPEARALE